MNNIYEKFFNQISPHCHWYLIKNAPLSLFVVWCSLISVLPEQPIILDRWGRQLNGTILGPKQEGDDIVITCRVVGGMSKTILS